jgi:glycosyltransferase involved in cell wall biosynthesis
MITHNRASFITDAIRSVQKQSYTDWELVIVDNGSTDTTPKLIRQYQVADARIQYIQNAVNEGVVPARNQALRASRGELVAVLDSDDVWIATDKLERQVALLQENEVSVVGTGIVYIDEKGEEIKREQKPASDRELRARMLSTNQLAHSSVMYRRAEVQEIGGYPDREIGEDYELLLSLGLRGTLVTIPEYMTGYRIHAGNVTRKKRLIGLKNNLEIIRQFKDVYPNYYPAYIRRKLRYMVGTLRYIV